MKLSERIKNKKKFIIGVVIGIVVVNIIGIAGAIAASVTSDIVLYDSPTGKKNVKDAIDELYGMSSTHCPDGYTCTNNRIVEDVNIVTASGKTYFAIAYFDPTNLITGCNAYNSVSATGTKTGCMKWYVYKEDSNYYYAILDHNTAGATSFSNAQTKVTTDTSSWVSSLNPRLITADEIAEITGNTSWSQSTASASDWFYLDSNSQAQTATSQGASNYAWLFDYTNSCTSYGCNTADSGAPGYWTSDTVADYPTDSWLMDKSGSLNHVNTHYTTRGVRPVVSISKS